MNTQLQDRLAALNQEIVSIDCEIEYYESYLGSTSGPADDSIDTLRRLQAKRHSLQMQVGDIYNEICNG